MIPGTFPFPALIPAQGAGPYTSGNLAKLSRPAALLVKQHTLMRVLSTHFRQPSKNGTITLATHPALRAVLGTSHISAILTPHMARVVPAKTFLNFRLH